jgi:hypothetical protein
VEVGGEVQVLSRAARLNASATGEDPRMCVESYSGGGDPANNQRQNPDRERYSQTRPERARLRPVTLPVPIWLMDDRFGNLTEDFVETRSERSLRDGVELPYEFKRLIEDVGAGGHRKPP